MQSMLDLTVNRMLLNPDTVAKISDLVNEHEDVQLELIFMCSAALGLFTKVGFIYTFWYSLLSTSSILE